MAYTISKNSRCDIPLQLVRKDPETQQFFHKDTNELFYGVAGNGNTWRYLFISDDNDFTPKTNCKLFRYSSAATQAIGMFPIASLNEERGLIYFWNSEEEKWETKGLKLDFLCIHE